MYSREPKNLGKDFTFPCLPLNIRDVSRNSRKGAGPSPSLPPIPPSPLEVGPRKPASGFGGVVQAPTAGSAGQSQAENEFGVL